MVQDRAALAMADQWYVVYDLSNGAIINDLEGLNNPTPGYKVTPLFDGENSETVRNIPTVSTEY